MSLYEALANTTVTICTDLPLRVNSLGLWNRSERWTVNATTPLVNFSFPLQNYTMPILEFEMTLMFVLTELTHLFLKIFGLPALAAQLVDVRWLIHVKSFVMIVSHPAKGVPAFEAGILLGDAGLSRIVKSSSHHDMNPIFPFANQEILNIMSLFGYIFFSFLIGVKLNLGLIPKSGKKALYTGALSLSVPIVAGVGTIILLHSKWFLNGQEIVQLAFLTAMHSLTPSPVVVCLLTNLKILNSELGRLALSSALVSDLCTIAITSVAAMATAVQQNMLKGIRDIVVMVAYTLFVWLVFRPFMFWIAKRTPQGKPIKDSYVVLIMLAFLGSALLSNWCELSFVTGPLMLGFAVPDGPPVGATLVNKFDFMVNRVFMPVFATTSMMRVTMSLPKAHKRTVLAAAIVTSVVYCSKFVASLVIPLCCKMHMRDAIALALILCSKGVVELGAYTFASDTWIIFSEVFDYMMLTIVLYVLIVPPLIRLLYDPKRKYVGYQKRNLMHWKPNSELRILACINRADNTPAIINFLDASCPTRDSPIAVYVLHLVKLVGRAAPVLISHNLQKRTLSNNSLSENVIISFSNFQRDNEGAVFAQVFTAITQPDYMYDDICTLAIDKATSLIILPFHRKWSRVNGSIESENQNTRTLNCRMLETAPCSVGILVNRGHVKYTNSSASPNEAYRVALIFLGGSDDREALTLAKRVAKDAYISLTVIRLVDASGDEDGNDKWEWVQDNEMLKEMKYNGAGYVSYVEQIVEDGIKTTRKIRSLMDENEYDMFIVGRRFNVSSPQTLGLDQWSEFPELGVIGDMLSSTDSRCKSSVLVIQQQQQR